MCTTPDTEVDQVWRITVEVGMRVRADHRQEAWSRALARLREGLGDYELLVVGAEPDD